MNVQVGGGAGAGLLQDAAHGLRHVVGHHPGELEPAVDDHAALLEVQDLQVLEARQVGLQVRPQLHADVETAVTEQKAGGPPPISSYSPGAGRCSPGLGTRTTSC